MKLKLHEIVFATSNRNKVTEVALKLGLLQLQGLSEIGFTGDIPETAETLEGNAQLKARFVWEKFGRPCFADDTGLEVNALNNHPGVRSARYAGDEGIAANNIRKLLDEMKNVVDRRAQFRTVICLKNGHEEFLFEGIVKGHITREQRGTGGFGYDPVFVAEGNSRTFAEMTMLEKNFLSHRGIAIALLRNHLTVGIA